MQLYTCQSSNPRWNAQRNLCGRTHYVDDDTLRFHKSKILSARATDGGLLFAIVTSDARDMNNTSRGFRFVIFDLFGTVVQRDPDRIDATWYKSSNKATKAMWDAVNKLDAVQITRDAIRRAEKQFTAEMLALHVDIDRLILTEKIKAHDHAAA